MNCEYYPNSEKHDGVNLHINNWHTGKVTGALMFIKDIRWHLL